ncbi:monovalent cation/H+ antiporter subunit B [Staphylococcus devriesei]|uniref:Na(+)/H(+) antiporter subunit B n=1 Tax=Staphylococcus devriesei TaxID=586733 RepID=A0A2K4DQQ7_9STAP|nr:Na+/H+ antiporter Mnh2 subunit B [Staphylococcus devriesei]MCE5090637.1 Na+/H+ antiporter Mnh2 subunit B [Staphylococcus devriesei]MCE5096765.1 Na+/H+ antiporter Mnh2 subunit B [Staphylococcus devriesei]PNZ89138.1 Na(+)/H(+) antiporter subunit B [Staphylococcus devriesei]PTE73458.1 Na(+)/H(+) antiporter subunit B [Staphylococcus devriesei]PTF05162.1 Na(+)/H(+) antiporter subunit B [Staphylococcus devriesei]
MKENDVVLRTVTKIVVFILLTFGFYVFFAGHNNPGGGFIGGLIFSSAFILMFLAFDVRQVLESLPIDFKKLMIIGAMISLLTAIVPIFFGKAFLYQTDAHLHLPLLGDIHVTTVTLFELGVLLTVVGVIVTIMLALSGGKS